MSQQSVLNIIESAKKPLTASEIANKLSVGECSVRKSLLNLVRQREIIYKEKTTTFHFRKIRHYTLNRNGNQNEV